MKNICLLALGMTIGALAMKYAKKNPDVKKLMKKINID